MAVRPADVRSTWSPRIPDDVVAVAESGIRGPGDVRRLRDAGYDAFLVGEHLMLARRSRGRAGGAASAAASAPRWAAAPRGAGAGGGEDLRDHLAWRTALMAARGGRGRRRASSSGRRARARWTSRAARAHRRRAAAVRPARRRVRGRAAARRCARAADEVGPRRAAAPRRRAAGGAARACRGARSRRVRVGAGFRPEDALRYEGTRGRHPARHARRRRRCRAAPGRTFDWTLARAACASTRRFLVLAGGLTPENVARGDRGGAARTRSTSRAASSRRPGRKDPAQGARLRATR